MRVIDVLGIRLQRTRQPHSGTFAVSLANIMSDLDAEPRNYNSTSVRSISDYTPLDDLPLRSFHHLPPATMSTRRSTRATSRQASSRGASPAISTADIPATPRRPSRRGGAAGNAPLPVVGTRTSTAYGTNTVPEPARATGPQVGQQLNSVLGDILDPIAAATTPGSKFLL